MTKFVSALLAAATIAVPALAEPTAQPIAFERAGIRYVGTVTNRADGTQLIAGHEVESGHTFELTVDRGHVDGIYDNMPVSYAAPKARRTATTASAAVVNVTGM